MKKKSKRDKKGHFLKTNQGIKNEEGEKSSRGYGQERKRDSCGRGRNNRNKS